ncbi:unnamed protein product [Prorocentrum cordatum]|uniref:Protochlorophyllide reductase n=1 Tax=Prorocentrum cordatum TaxID=2364126 RepID=A0ABN9RA90_9DINO|nr:unnamed protein product [Polarella glacialis]
MRPGLRPHVARRAAPGRARPRGAGVADPSARRRVCGRRELGTLLGACAWRLRCSGRGMILPTASTSSPQRPSRRYYRDFLELLPSMEGKAVVVTGASRGLGFVTALAVAGKGASVYMLSRKSQRSVDAVSEVSAAATGAAPRFVECDHLDFSSVRAAADELKAEAAAGIDVLCCNAGVMLQPDLPSKDGYDVTISTNVLSHFLLARELMPLLERAASLRGEARLVSMSSASAAGPPSFDARFFAQSGGRLGGPPCSYERYHSKKRKVYKHKLCVYVVLCSSASEQAGESALHLCCRPEAEAQGQPREGAGVHARRVRDGHVRARHVHDAAGQVHRLVRSGFGGGWMPCTAQVHLRPHCAVGRVVWPALGRGVPSEGRYGASELPCRRRRAIAAVGVLRARSRIVRPMTAGLDGPAIKRAPRGQAEDRVVREQQQPLVL